MYSGGVAAYSVHACNIVYRCIIHDCHAYTCVHYIPVYMQHLKSICMNHSIYMCMYCMCTLISVSGTECFPMPGLSNVTQYWWLSRSTASILPV